MKVQTGDLKWKEIFLKPAGDTLPVGSITEFGGSIIPTNWLKCDGSLISRATYPQLFKVIGTSYGVGDGSTTFKLPTMESENAIVIIKAKNSIGAAGTVVEDMDSSKHDDVPNAKAVRDYVKEHGLIVSPTEPTTGEEVWIKKGKNLLNKYNFTLSYTIGSDGIWTYNDKNAISDIIEVNENETYTISSNSVMNGLVAHYLDENKNWFNRDIQSKVSSNTFTTPTRCKYVRISFNYDNTTAVTQALINSLDLQLEQNSTATEYEEYIEKEIYVKNDNGVYDLFEKVKKTQYCVAKIDEKKTLTYSTQWERNNISFDKILRKSGDFTISDGKIIIGKDISKVKVTFNVLVQTITTSKDFAVHLMKNSSSMGACITVFSAYSNASGCNIIPVTEGDEIYISIQNQWAVANELKVYGVSSDALYTYMVVESID